MRSDWIQLDELRESWVFLILGNTQRESTVCDSDPTIEYWEIGIGNPDNLIESYSEHLENPRIRSETELLELLLSNLNKFRYQGPTLVTSSRGDLRDLRKWVIQCEMPNTSLRGFHHVNLEDLLARYCDAELSNYGIDEDSRLPPRVIEPDHDEVVTAGAVKELWEFWTEYFRLFPPAELEGETL